MQPRGLGMPAMRAATLAGPLGKSWYALAVWFAALGVPPRSDAGELRRRIRALRTTASR